MNSRQQADRETITVITTGGTIDGLDYDLPEGAPPPENAATRIPMALEHARLAVAVTVRPLLNKDSRAITPNDRAAIAATIDSCRGRQIVVTHGTETLEDTAQYLSSHAPKGKTIVIMGAMTPLFDPSGDAEFNLGAALLAVQLLPPGVHVVMNGRVLPASDVTKDRLAGKFVRASAREARRREGRPAAIAS